MKVCTFTLGIIKQFPQGQASSDEFSQGQASSDECTNGMGPILSTQEVKASFLTNPVIARSSG